MKMNKEARARLDGMEYAFRRIKEIGMDGFEKELKWRGADGISIAVSPEELRNASSNIEDKVYKSLMGCSLLALHDELDLERDDLMRYLKRFNIKIQGLNANYAEWDDYVEAMAAETGINISKIGWER